MTPTTETMARVLDHVRATLSGAARRKVGGLPADALFLLEVISDEEARVLVGERVTMRQALLIDGRIDANASHFLAHAAPRGFVWCVIDWGDEVTTLLHSADGWVAPDRRVS